MPDAERLVDGPVVVQRHPDEIAAADRAVRKIASAAQLEELTRANIKLPMTKKAEILARIRTILGPEARSRAPVRRPVQAQTPAQCRPRTMGGHSPAPLQLRNHQLDKVDEEETDNEAVSLNDALEEGVCDSDCEGLSELDLEVVTEADSERLSVAEADLDSESETL